MSENSDSSSKPPAPSSASDDPKPTPASEASAAAGESEASQDMPKQPGSAASPAESPGRPQAPAAGTGGNRFGIQVGGAREPGDPAFKVRPAAQSHAAAVPKKDVSSVAGSEARPEEPPRQTTESPESGSEADSLQAEDTAAGPPPALSPPMPAPLPPKPSVRDPLPQDLEDEIAAALGDMTLEQLTQEATTKTSGDELEIDSRVRGIVIRLHADNVFFSLGGHHEGVASVRQFAEPPEPGAAMDVVVLRFNSDDGLYELQIPGASIQVGDWSDIAEGSLVEARVTGSNTGGLECTVNNIRGFIPASQIALYRVENLPDFVDQKLVCAVTEVNPQRGNLVLSRRAVLEREREDARRKLLEELQVGQTREGVVRSLREFGAFVDLGGVDGLIHISQLSWDRVNHPSDVLQEGQKVKVRVEKVDRQTEKIGLSYRDLLENPWTTAQKNFPAGATVRGTVSRIANFGAFVKLSPGVEGLVHISEIAHQRVKSVAAVLKEGQEVDVKVLDVNLDDQRIALSIKQTLEAPQAGDSTAAQEEDEAPRELAVKRRGEGPLKGGVDRPSGGDQFGLKW